MKKTYEIHFTDWTHYVLDLTKEQYNDLMKASRTMPENSQATSTLISPIP